MQAMLGAILPKQMRQQKVGLVHAHRDDPVARRRDFGDEAHHAASGRVGRAPAFQAGDHIPPQHRGAVVEAQTLAQREGPELVVLVDRMAFDHLRLRVVLGVAAVERVVDHVAIGAGLRRGVDHRVEDGEVDIGHEAQHAGARGPADARQGQRPRRGEQASTFHFPLRVSFYCGPFYGVPEQRASPIDGVDEFAVRQGDEHASTRPRCTASTTPIAPVARKASSSSPVNPVRNSRSSKPDLGTEQLPRARAPDRRRASARTARRSRQAARRRPPCRAAPAG